MSSAYVNLRAKTIYRHCYSSQTEWRTNNEAPAVTDEGKLQIPVKFNLYKSTKTGYIIDEGHGVSKIEVDDDGVSEDSRTLETKCAINVVYLQFSTSLISRISHEVIKSMGVPQGDEQSTIVAKILDVVKVVPIMEPPHHMFLNVDIYDTTLELLHWADVVHFCLHWHDDLVSYRLTRSTPATESAINKLKKVRLDRLELGRDCYAGSTMCVVCKEDFDFENAAGLEVIRLPCLHLYHEHCIGPWLRISSECPTCHRSVLSSDRNKARPTQIHAQEGNPDEPTSLQLSLLIKLLSICYIIFLFLMAIIKFLLRKVLNALSSK